MPTHHGYTETKQTPLCYHRRRNMSKNWNGSGWASLWPRSKQSNRWRPQKWWSEQYWLWYWPQSAWQLSKSPCKFRCEYTSSWWGGSTNGVQRNRCPQSTSPLWKWQCPPKCTHYQAIMPNPTHRSHYKKSGYDRHKCINHHGKGPLIDIHQQRSVHIGRGHGQPTTIPLEMSNGREMNINPAQ